MDGKRPAAGNAGTPDSRRFAMSLPVGATVYRFRISKLAGIANTIQTDSDSAMARNPVIRDFSLGRCQRAAIGEIRVFRPLKYRL